MSLRTLPLVVLTFLLAACEPTGTSTRNPLAPTALSPLNVQSPPVSANAQSVERPNRGQFVFNVDHIQIPAECTSPPNGHFCQAIRSTFGGRCTVPSNFMEFGTGSGEMTHGGRVEASWSHCTRVSAGITFRDGTMTMEVANGDKLTFSYGAGALSFVNGNTLIESPFTITGGTGRFQGASGGGTLHGEAPGARPVDLLDGMPFETTIDGTITYAPGRGGQ